MCGEQPSSHPVEVRVAGSPPRVRGTDPLVLLLLLSLGITPACAGNSLNLS